MWTVLAVLALLGVAPLARAEPILYATAATTNGVDGFCIRGNGSLAPTPQVHRDTQGTQPRRLIVGSTGMLFVVEVDRVEAFQIRPGGGLVLAGDLVYVESLLDRRLLAFHLTNGQFEAPTFKKTGEPVPFVRAPCLQQDDVDHTAVKGPFRWQKPSSKTRSLNAYQDVVLNDDTLTLYGSEFLRGRVDAFRLQSGGELPRGTAGTTKEDVRGS